MITAEEYRALLEESNEGQHTHHADHEHSLQVECVNWFRWKYRPYIILAIPNGGQRNVRVARKLKAEGVVAGVPDLFIPTARGEYHGLWIEMKNGKKGVVSDKQKEMIDYLIGQGYKAEVARSKEEFEDIVDNYFK